MHHERSLGRFGRGVLELSVRQCTLHTLRSRSCGSSVAQKQLFSMFLSIQGTHVVAASYRASGSRIIIVVAVKGRVR